MKDPLVGHFICGIYIEMDTFLQEYKAGLILLHDTIKDNENISR